MHESDKLAEAGYFLKRMREEQENSEAFRFNLSAFLSAARSVLQYALEEAKTKTGGQFWYDNLINSSDILKYFKDKRDINIHQAPIRPMERHQVTITSTAYITDSVHVVLKDKDGNIKQELHSESKNSEPPKPDLPANHIVSYFFTHWSGDEDVIQLCDKYLKQLIKAVDEGVQNALISR